MTYVPTSWQDLPNTTTAITAARLNNMEAGIVAAYVQGTGGLLNVDIGAGAAIAYSKLNLAGSIVTGDIADGTIVNADVSASAAIAYTKLNLASSIVTGDIVNGTILDADISASAAIQMSKINGLGLYRKSTSKAVNTTTAATDLLNGEITVAANAIGATGVLRLKAWGDFLQNTGAGRDAPRLQLVLGGTTFLDTGIGTAGCAAPGASRLPWELECYIQNATASSQTAKLRFDLYSGGQFTSSLAAFTTGSGYYGDTSTGGGPWILSALGINTGLAVDTTSARALVLNVINGTSSASYETKLLGALVEII